MQRISWLTFLLILCGFSACIPTNDTIIPVGPTVTYNPFATLSPTPFGPIDNTPVQIISPTIFQNSLIPTGDPAASLKPRPLYILDAALDFNNHRLSVEENIAYPNNTGKTLETLVLAVEPNHWMGCFILVAITVDSQETEYTLDGHRLEIDLASPLFPEVNAIIELRYSLQLPETDSYHLFGYHSNQVNLVDWFPFVVPYTSGWLLHEPGEVGEHLAYEAADFDVGLVVEPEMPVAASAPLVSGRYRLERARTFAFSASPEFEMTTARLGVVILTSYYFEAEKDSAETVLLETFSAISTFSELFGAYPYPSLSIVETRFYDGMEYDGLFFLGREFYLANDGTKLNYMIDLAVHETAHQWWFGNVGNDQAMEPWLDEALSTYSEFLLYERLYPGIAETWWQFRVKNITDAKAVNSSIYETDDNQDYTNSVYFHGAQFLRDLRTRIGDGTFFLFIKEYAMQMRGRIATADDFFKILQEITTVDFTDLKSKYFQVRP